MVQFCPGRCSVVSLPGGGAVAPLSAADLLVLEAPAPVSAVVGSGRLHPCPGVLPVARTAGWRDGHTNRISL